MKKAIAVVVTVVFALGAFRVLRKSDDGGEAQLIKQIWIDRIPEKPRDVYELFVAVKQKRDRFGVFYQGSSWKMMQEIFFWEPGSGGLTIAYPQTEKKEKATYRVYACSEGPFTLCLDIKGNSRGIHHYGSNEDLELGTAPHSPEAAAAEVRARLARR